MRKATSAFQSSGDDRSFEQTFIRAIRKGKPETWVPTDTPDNELAELMRLAFDALCAEDEELADILGARGAIGREYQERGAPGLSYWVFEHNLVYTIFKAWARSYRVLWDERVNARWSGRFDATARQSAANDNQPRSLIDLQVITARADDERWLFEMQWLNNSKGVEHARKDADKLRSILNARRSSRGEKRPRAFLLGIWSNVESQLANDFDWLRGNRPARTKAAFYGILPSPKTNSDDRSYHFIALLEVER